MTLGRVIRFSLVGVINTAVYYCLYLLLQSFVPYLVAHVFAFGLAMIGSYFFNCRFTFQTKPSWRSFLLFPLSNLSNFLITTGGLYVLVHRFGLDPRWAALPAALIAVPITFLAAQFALTGGREDNPHSQRVDTEQTSPGRGAG